MSSPESDKKEGALQCSEYVLAFISGGAEKYYQQANHNVISGHALTYWPVDPKKSLSDCIKRITEFYYALNNNEFKAAPDAENDDLITLIVNNREISYPLDAELARAMDLEGVLLVINNTIVPHRFSQFKLSTAYADLTFEILAQKNRLLSVKSSQRIAEPLSELIAATTAHKILPGKILSSLERIYDFG